MLPPLREAPAPTPMLSLRREVPARRAPLPSPAAFTFANYHRCSPLEEKHRLDEHHCIQQQQSPSPTKADPLL
jgi:hypothetical protein